MWITTLCCSDSLWVSRFSIAVSCSSCTKPLRVWELRLAGFQSFQLLLCITLEEYCIVLWSSTVLYCCYLWYNGQTFLVPTAAPLIFVLLLACASVTSSPYRHSSINQSIPRWRTMQIAASRRSSRISSLTCVTVWLFRRCQKNKLSFTVSPFVNYVPRYVCVLFLLYYTNMYSFLLYNITN